MKSLVDADRPKLGSFGREGFGGRMVFVGYGEKMWGENWKKEINM